MKIKVITLLIFSLSSLWVYSQDSEAEFGSTFVGSDGLFFADNSGSRFDQAGTQPGLLTVGFFGNVGSNSTFSDYLNDYTQFGSESDFASNATGDGFMTANSGKVTDPEASAAVGETPFTMLLGGVSNFGNASSATSFSIFNDSGWSAISAPSSPTAFFDFKALQPDNIIEGSIGSVSDGFEIQTTPVPEPSTYALLLGVSALVFVMVRRKVS